MVFKIEDFSCWADPTLEEFEALSSKGEQGAQTKTIRQKYFITSYKVEDQSKKYASFPEDATSFNKDTGAVKRTGWSAHLAQVQSLHGVESRVHREVEQRKKGFEASGKRWKRAS